MHRLPHAQREYTLHQPHIRRQRQVTKVLYHLLCPRPHVFLVFREHRPKASALPPVGRVADVDHLEMQGSGGDVDNGEDLVPGRPWVVLCDPLCDRIYVVIIGSLNPFGLVPSIGVGVPSVS